MSLNKSIDELEEFQNKLSHFHDIICVTETRTNKINVKNINISGYNFFYSNSSTRAGGAGIYIIDALTCHELLSFLMIACENVWIEVIANPKINLSLRLFIDIYNKNFKLLKLFLKQI